MDHFLHTDPAIREWLEAARSGDLARVVSLLDRGMDVDAGSEIDTTALMLAVRAGHVEVIQLLLDRGADLRPENSLGDTALTIAVIVSRTWDGYWQIDQPDPRPLQLLLAAGARYGLREAVLLNNVPFARARLEEGADPNTGTFSYHGPLLKIAAELGYVEMVDLLLDHGADIEATDDLGQRPLLSAARYGRIDVVRRLLDRGADLDAVGWSEESALANAAAAGHRDVVELLFSRGARRGVVDAVCLGDAAILDVLLEERLRDDGEIDRITDARDRIAMLAAGLGEVRILRRLLDRGARHLDEIFDAHSLLAEAARQGRSEVVRLLIDRRADLHACGHDGLTPLAWAIREGQDEVVEMLRAAGASR